MIFTEVVGSNEGAALELDGVVGSSLKNIRKSLYKRGSVYILRIIVEESAKFKEKQEQQFRQSKHNMNANTKLEKVVKKITT